MNNKKDIEDIHTIMQIRNMFEHLKKYGWINDLKRDIEPHRAVQAIENILADRERLEEMLKKSDANNIELQKEIEVLKNDTYWKGYIDKQNEAIEICKICKYKAKANKYDSLVENIKKDLIKLQEEYEILLEHQSGQESNRTKYLRGKIHMCQELLDTEKEKI